MIKVRYKGNNLPLICGEVYDVNLIWDDDCEYVYVVLNNGIRFMYDGERDMERDWDLCENE